jgi:pimeloyl-ACP methyl ester carboxylesterase
MSRVEPRTADLGGTVHYLDFGGKGKPLVCVHGLAGSALNWLAVGDRLAQIAHVLALDLRGFGHSALASGSRLDDNRVLLDRFLREVAGIPAILVANSMGAMVAEIQAARAPETVSHLVLSAPALPWRILRPIDLPILSFFAFLMLPGIAHHQLHWWEGRLGPERMTRNALAICAADVGRISDVVMQAHIDLELERFELGHSLRALTQAARSLVWAMLTRREVSRYHRIRAPVLILQGDRDRLIPAAHSRSLAERMGWELRILNGVGHVPMLEAPDLFCQAVLDWLGSIT